MPLRPSLLSRWISPAELLQRSTLRATHIPLPTGSIHSSLPLLRRQAAFKTTQRSLTTANYVGRPASRSRPGLRSIQLPKRRLNRRYNSGSSNSSSQPKKEGNSLSQRLRKLSREYGWAALGVYFGLSALDFPFCFLAVRLLGVDRIGHFEHVVVQSVKDAFHSVFPKTESKPQGEDTQTSLARAEERSQEEASIWAQLALAYAIHKSFIFIRVPMTAAVTPKVVKTLRRWGWDIGKRKPKNP
ncbi:hypothetical protein PENDEC_c021G00728 [Penicillium decumbens]|uniref:DUF1279 domain-containing protein n=1 Tax=Penicillium decumbens TaxID=69771 RepID=A0A1V6P6R9_PENDC|nr:hypothetical protein PENDEC_c021G00728 [Penicillium decumbens]